VVEAIAGMERRKVAKIKMALTPAAARKIGSARVEGPWTGYLTDQWTMIHQEVFGDIGNSLGGLQRGVRHQDNSQQKTTAGGEEEVEDDEDEQYFVCHDRDFRWSTLR
jgi:hypothetical protein